MTPRYMHLGPALDRPVAVQSLGDILETRSVSDGKINGQNNLTGGEAGIRTLGRGFGPYNGLANRRLQPLGHLTMRGFPKDSADSRGRKRLRTG